MHGETKDRKIKKYLLNYYKYVMGKNFTDKLKFDLLYIKRLKEENNKRSKSVIKKKLGEKNEDKYKRSKTIKKTLFEKRNYEGKKNFFENKKEKFVKKKNIFQKSFEEENYSKKSKSSKKNNFFKKKKAKSNIIKKKKVYFKDLIKDIRKSYEKVNIDFEKLEKEKLNILINTEEIFHLKFKNFYSKKNLNKILSEKIDLKNDRIYSAPISKRNSEKNKIFSVFKKKNDNYDKEDSYIIVYDFEKRNDNYKTNSFQDILDNQNNLEKINNSKKYFNFQNQNNSDKYFNLQNQNNSEKLFNLENENNSEKFFNFKTVKNQEKYLNFENQNNFSKTKSSKNPKKFLLKESSNFSSETFEKLLIPFSKQSEILKSKNLTFFSESENLVSKLNSKLKNNYKKNDNLSKITEKINLLKKSDKSIDSIFVYKKEGFKTNLQNQIFESFMENSKKSFENNFVKKNTLCVTLGNYDEKKKFIRTEPLNVTGFL